MLPSLLRRAAAVIPVAVAACAVGTTAAAAPVSTAKMTLTARLVTSKDLTTGWGVLPSAGFDSGLPPCLEKIYHRAPDQHAAAERTFSASDGLTTFQDRLVSFNDGTAAARAASFERSVASCETSPKGPLIAVDATRFAAVGHQSRAFVLTFGRPGTNRVYAVLVLARQGDIVIVTSHGSLVHGTAQAKRFAKRAIEKAA